MAEYDVVVVGAGNNGLIVAAYLAKAGLRTCVLEARDFIGGGVVTREATLPGFKHDLGAAVAMWIDMNPIIQNDELGLVKNYGLKFLPPPEVQEVILFPDGRSIIIYRDLDKTCASIARINQKDAESFKRFVEWATPLFKPVLRGSNMPPPPFGNFLTMLTGSVKGLDLMRTTLLNAVDLCNEWFTSDEMKIAMTRWAAQARISPYESGTAEGIMFMAPFATIYGAKPIEGGAGRFTECLGRAIQGFGSTIRTSTTVQKVIVKDGKAEGVVLDSGDQIKAKKAVVLGLNIKQIFPNMVEGAQMPPNFISQVQRLRAQRTQYLTWHLAINQAPIYKADGDIDRGFQVQPFPTTNYEEYLDSLTKMYRGNAKTDSPGILCTTIFDPTRAPAGKHTLWVMHQEPFYLKEGPAHWDNIKKQVRDGILTTIQKHVSNMDESNILGEMMLTPLDYARWNPSWIEGDPSHIGGYLTQYMSNRPLPGWSGYKMPVEHLYLCGPSTHPGTGINAGARAPANVIMKDLGIEFDKVI